MNTEALREAAKRIPHVPVLINAVSQRVRQCHMGHRPYVKPAPGEEVLDVVLREIAEGKFTVEIDFAAHDVAEEEE